MSDETLDGLNFPHRQLDSLQNVKLKDPLFYDWIFLKVERAIVKLENVCRKERELRASSDLTKLRHALQELVQVVENITLDDVI